MGSAYAGQFRPSGWEAVASGNARTPLASSNSDACKHHRHQCHQHQAWQWQAGGACDGRSEHHQHRRVRRGQASGDGWGVWP